MQFEKLNPEFKAKWLTALRSGKYKQGKGELKSGDYYCCLGVAGAIAGLSDKKLNLCNYLNERLAEEIELIPRELRGSGDNETIKFLTSKNDGSHDHKHNPDSEKWDFNQIADWIELNL